MNGFILVIGLLLGAIFVLRKRNTEDEPVRRWEEIERPRGKYMTSERPESQAPPPRKRGLHARAERLKSKNEPRRARNKARRERRKNLFRRRTNSVLGVPPARRQKASISSKATRKKPRNKTSRKGYRSQSSRQFR